MAIVALAAAVCVANGQLGSTSWPEFLGGNSNANYSPYSGTLPVLKAQFFENETTDGSLSVGTSGEIFTLVSDSSTGLNYLGAISPSSGAASTPVQTEYAFDTTPTVDANGNVLVSTYNDGLYSYNSVTGSINWLNSSPEGGGCSPVIASDGTVYITDIRGIVFAIDGTNGHTNWAQTLDNFYSSPAVGSDGTIYVDGEDNGVYALNPLDGSTKWTFSIGGGGIGCSPAIGPSGNIYVTDNSGDVYAIRASDGAKLWAQNLGTSIYSSPAISPDGTLYVSSGTGVFAINGSTGAVIWNSDGQNPYYAAPTIDSNGTVFATNLNGTVTAFNGANGDEIWSYAAGIAYIGCSSMIDSDGTLYVPSGGGGSYGVSAFDTFDHATITFDSSSVTGGTGTNATLTLPGPTLTDITVPLRSQNPNYLTVPTSVTISAGSTSATFAVTTKGYSSTYALNVNAAWDGVNISAPLTVMGDHITRISCNPSAVYGSSSSTGTVTLLSPAPAGGWTVSLTSETPEYVTVPSSVTVEQGSQTATFPITTKAYVVSYTTTIFAQDQFGRHSNTIEVVNDSIKSLSLSPSMVSGGHNSTGKVTLLAPAPASGFTVNLLSEKPSYVGVPATVTILPGQTTATFPITTKAYIKAYTATIACSDAVTKQAAVLTVIQGSISP